MLDDADGAEEVLRSASLPFSTIEVLALELSDEPGALGKVAVRLAEAGINVEYAYATAVSGMARALCVFKVADPSVAEASLGQS